MIREDLFALELSIVCYALATLTAAGFRAWPLAGWLALITAGLSAVWGAAP